MATFIDYAAARAEVHALKADKKELRDLLVSAVIRLDKDSFLASQIREALRRTSAEAEAAPVHPTGSAADAERDRRRAAYDASLNGGEGTDPSWYGR